MVKRDSFVARNYQGGLDTSSGYDAGEEGRDITSFIVANNFRFTSLGGVSTRLGFELKGDMGTSAAIDNLWTHEPYAVLFGKSGTKIKQSVNDGVTWYDIGLTRTASEVEDFLSVEKDVHVSNATDAYTRIAVTTLVSDISAGAGSLNVRTGDGSKFTNGTIYIDGEPITVSSIATDAFTLTGATVDSPHLAGAIITQTSTPSGAPKASCLGILDGHVIAGGVAANRSNLPYSAAFNTEFPQYAYDFTGNGAGVHFFPTDIVDINSITGGAIIATKKGIHYASVFDVNTEALIATEVNGTFGGVNNRCLVQGQKMTYLLDAKNKRILPIVNDQNGVNLLDDPLRQRNNLDYPVQGFMAGIDDDQTLSGTAFDPVTTEVSFTVYKNGISYDIVFQENVSKWSIDIGKNFKCRTNFNGKSICGSDYNAEIYLNNSGLTDNTVPIYHRLLSPIYTIDDKRMTMEFLNFTCGGLLSSLGEFTLRMYVNDLKVFERLITADTLVDAGLMSRSSGTPIGSGTLGASTIGSGGASPPTGYRFTYPADILFSGETFQFEIEIFEEGTALELRDSRTDYETEAESIFTHL